MSSTFDEEATYEVRVRGRLDESWSDWLNGVTISFEDEACGGGLTVLTGHFDQAALRGLLNRLWDLNVTVERIAHLDTDQRDSPLEMPAGAT